MCIALIKPVFSHVCMGFACGHSFCVSFAWMQCTFIMHSPKVFRDLARFFFTTLLGVCMMGSSVATDIYFYRFYFSSEIRSI